jgi:S-(hydroxymethyl)glutathione dehydrogenase/alcohol dehydrogenase
MVLAPRKTLAAVLEKVGEPLAIREIEIPHLIFGQVLVKILFSGVCRSQLMEISGCRGKDNWLPHLLGHEGSGEVIEIGPGVTKVKPGDKVVLGWIKSSGIDAEPAKYRYKNKLINSGRVTTFSNYSVISESRLNKLPNGLALDEAVLYGCALPTGAGMVMNELDIRPSNSVLILGIGGVGISALLMLKAFGTKKIIAVDKIQSKVDFALTLGVKYALNSSEKNFNNEIKKIIGDGVDFCIESSGKVQTIELGFSMIKKGGGQLLFASHPPSEEKINILPYDLICGKKISGSWGGGVNPDKDISRIYRKLKKNGISLESLIKKRYKLTEINQAISDLELGLVFRPIIEMW